MKEKLRETWNRKFRNLLTEMERATNDNMTTQYSLLMDWIDFIEQITQRSELGLLDVSNFYDDN